MALFQEFEFEHEKDIKLITLTCDIACEKAMIDFNMADISLQTYMEDGDEPKKGNGKFVETIHRIFKAILTALQDFAAALGLHGTEKITLDDFVSSDAGRVQISYDMEKVHKIINDELAEGNKLIKKLSHVTGKTPTEINDYILGDHSLGRAKLEDAVSAATAVQWYQKFAGKEGIRSVESYIKDAERTAAAIKDADAQKAVIRISNTMKHAVLDYIRIGNIARSQIERNMAKRANTHK